MNSRRYYLDYNATSPLSKSVINWLQRGDFLFGNPSSVHSTGKKSKREINLVKDELYQRLNFSEDTFDLFFHSGATEGINTIVKGWAKSLQQQNLIGHFFYLSTDHSCVHNLREELLLDGHKVTMIDVDQNGDVDVDRIIQLLLESKDHCLINLTWVNNETGVCLDLNEFKAIKERTDALVHIDAVQSLGKIENAFETISVFDFYTYSGHKFGAMKGVGFSFVKNSQKIHPLIRGGGQQQGMRSGTENLLGIMSLKFALGDLFESYNYEQLFSSKHFIEEKLKDLLGNEGEIVGRNSRLRNANTIYFICYKVKAHTLSMALDMAGIDVSNGSACSSGAVIPSRVLLSMGYSEKDATSAIRLSFSPFLNLEEAQAIWSTLEKVLVRFLAK